MKPLSSLRMRRAQGALAGPQPVGERLVDDDDKGIGRLEVGRELFPSTNGMPSVAK